MNVGREINSPDDFGIVNPFLSLSEIAKKSLEQRTFITCIRLINKNFRKSLGRI